MSIRPSVQSSTASSAETAVGGATHGSPALASEVRARNFIGWRIVGVAFLAQILSNGMTISAFSNFQGPVAETFGVGMGTIALGVPVAIASMGLLGPFVGRLVDRGHVRKLMFGGALWSGAGLLLLSRADSLMAAALYWSLFVCVGAALCGVMPATTMVANWFSRRRGFALGVMMSGATLVSYIAPASAQLIIDNAGWRSAVLCFGFVLLLIGAPIYGMLAVGRPEDVGQLPDGDVQPEASGSDAIDPASRQAAAKSAADLARDPRLWLSAIGFGLIMTSPIVLMTMLIPYAKGLGLTGQEANLFLAAMVPCSLFGKLVLGSLADRWPAKPLLFSMIAINIAVWLIFWSQPSFSLYVFSGALYGFGIGAASPLHGVVIGRLFGRVNFGTAMGLGGVSAILLLVLASTVSALVQGESGEGFPKVFLIQVGYLLVGALALALVRIPSVEEAEI